MPHAQTVLAALLEIPAEPRDIYWPTVLQAAGGFFLVVATGALVWATLKLVQATNNLADVGRKTWMSAVAVRLWFTIKNKDLTDSSKATVQIRNMSAVPVESVFIHIYAGEFWQDETEELSREIGLKPRQIKVGELAGDGISEAYNFWEDARKALEASSEKDDGHFPCVQFVGFARHSITQHVTQISFSYRVVDCGKGKIKLEYIEATNKELWE